MITAHEVIERLCKLQAEVHGNIGYHTSADCFCRYLKPFMYPDGYRNEGKALEFIEAAVREKLSKQTKITENYKLDPVFEMAMDTSVIEMQLKQIEQLKALVEGKQRVIANDSRIKNHLHQQILALKAELQEYKDREDGR